MEQPKTGAGLQQIVCSLQWVKASTPQFNKLIVPLINVMERVYTQAKIITKRKTFII